VISTNKPVTTVQQLSEAIAAATIDIDEQGRRIGIAVYDLLAQGDPVTPAEIAAHAHQPEGVVVATLQGWPGVFWDDQGRVVGFWGLAIPEMDHRFHAENGKPMYAWCALDPFLIVPVIGRPARVESKDPVTGEPITMSVTPGGINDLSPATTVVSFLAPNKPFDFDVIESFCHFVLNFASRESAERWAAEREGIVLLPTAEAFEVGLRAWSKWHPRANTEKAGHGIDDSGAGRTG
jgi:alkylmercury lyase